MRRASGVLAAKQQVAVVQTMADWLGPEKKKGKKKGPRSLPKFNANVEAARARVNAGEAWADAGPELLVGLYGFLHETVYGVPAIDCADAWAYAVSACRRMLSEAPFSGNVEQLVAFLRFTWTAENKAEKWARGEGRQRRRVTWRLQFATRHLLVDYLRSCVATAKTRPSSLHAAAS